MARDKRGKARATSPEIESPSSDSEETHDVLPARVQPKRKAMATKVPKRAHGRGRPDPQATSSQGSRDRMKRASTPSSQGDDDEGESLQYLE